MAAQDFYITQNDTTNDLQVTLKDADDSAVNVSGATIVFSMRNNVTKNIKIKEKSATIVTATSGIVKYEWVSGDTDTAGEFQGEFEVTYSGGDIQTFPNTDNNRLRIHIREEIA